MAANFGDKQPPYQRIEEVEDIDHPEKWFEELDAETEFAGYENEREQRLKRTELLRNSVIVRSIRQPDQLCKDLQEILRGDTIVVGVADEEDIRERDRKEAARKFNEKQEDAESFQQQAAEYQKLERLARQRLTDQLAAKQKELQAKADDAAVRDQERQEQLNKMLRAAEYKLQAALQQRKGELKITYGSLATDNAYTNFATEQVVDPQPLNKRAQFIGKKYQVDWTKAPQPLRIRLDLCRAVKDKLPQGQYVMMASVWNRLGGHRLQWSCLQNLEEKDLEAKSGKSMFKQVTELLDDKAKAKELTGIISTCSAVSAPVAHAGLWYTDILRFDQCMYMACPAEKDITPSMCLVFELYLLRGGVSPVDKVMAWAAFPLVDSDFGLIRGCFKLNPARESRGSINGNNGGQAATADECGKPYGNSIIQQSDVKAPMIRGSIDTSIDRYALYERRYRDDIQAWLCNFYFRCDRLPKYSAGQLEYEVQLSYTGKILGLKKKKNAIENTTESNRDMQKKADAAVKHLANALKDDNLFGENERVEATKDGVHAWKHMGEGDAVYKPLMHEENFTQYQYSVTSGHTLVFSSEITRKKRYIYDELFGDYSISSDVKELGEVYTLAHMFQRQTGYWLGGWTMKDYVRSGCIGICGFALVILFLAFWVCIYIHYFGQWLMLSAFRVPIYQFDVSFVTVKVGYVQDLLTADQEAAVVAAGPVMSYLVYLFMIGVVVTFQHYVGRIPSIVYSFLLSFGLATVFDPEFTLFVDVVNNNKTGDAFKLYNFFQKKDQNGIIGIVATCLIYAIFTAAVLVTFYQYMTKIHREGRIRDTHRRLTTDEPDFFVPLDNEVSLRYLKWICYKAKLFKGENGQTRRVQVTEFIVDEESQTAVKRLAQLGDIAAGDTIDEENLDNLQLGIDNKSVLSRLFKKKRITSTTYVCIHTLNPETKSRTLYRHFMRYPSGAIVELSPKESAQINPTERPPPSNVTQITYDEATEQPTKREELPLSDWVKRNFDDKPPALAAVGSGTSKSLQQNSPPQVGQRGTGGAPSGDGVEPASRLKETERAGRGSVSNSEQSEYSKAAEPNGTLKQNRQAEEEPHTWNSFLKPPAGVEVSRYSFSSSASVRRVRSNEQVLQATDGRHESQTSLTQYKVDDAFESEHVERSGEGLSLGTDYDAGNVEEAFEDEEVGDADDV